MKQIVITGAAGFIGSYLAGALNAMGFDDLILVDDFSREDKQPNWVNKKFGQKVDRKYFDNWFFENHDKVGCVFHLGARTDTTEVKRTIFNCLNLDYSKMVWQKCVKYNKPLIYASSAATYGAGELGYVDSHDIIPDLKPLNLYGESKNDFDKWVLQQTKKPSFWCGFKFFNVYGPNEYHKGRMASVIFHSYNQILQTGKVNLFKSHRPDFKNGMQLRDFVYVKDVANVLIWAMDHHPENGIYNLGTGHAEPFLTLVKTVFSALEQPEKIEFIPTPEDIRNKYQYFTEADISKLRNAGYGQPFSTLEEGAYDYVKNYLMTNKYF
ncbi:MAG: ADP-glyceromanno-heptose 6-epimerase [Bacteroidales bacterium]|nr:ADP-glyceromanno-heptose 6-epimerase [Bacteroidales bacterium]